MPAWHGNAVETEWCVNVRNVSDPTGTIAACARGDRDALGRLYESEAPMLLAVALRLVRRRELADEVLHDAFLDIWRGASSFDPARGPGRAWMIGIVRHRALKVLRHRSRDATLPTGLADAVPDETPDAHALLETAQDGAALHRCLDRLEPERRRIILLAYMDGLSQSEIAARLGAPLGTVKAWTRRSLLALRDCLS